MISAYKIGIEIALTGNVGKIIAELTRQFESVNAAVLKVQASVASLQTGMEKLGVAGRSAANAWKEAAEAMERANRSASSAGRSGGAGGAGGGAMGLALAAGAAGGALLGGPRVTPAGGGTGGGGGGGGQLRLSGPGGSGGGGGGGIWAPAAAAGAAMSGHEYAIAAAGYGAIGYGIFHGEREAIDAASEISHLRAMLIGQGVSPGAADDAIDRARTIARGTPGITITQAVESAVDLKSVLGGTSWNPASMEPAMTALPAFAKTMAVLNAIGKQKGDPTFAAAKAQELLGHLVDEKTGGVSSLELQKHLDATSQVALATNNRVSATDYLAFVKQARIAGIGLDDEALYRDMPALIMEMGGSRAGTGLAAFARQFQAGTMTKAKFSELQKLGLFETKTNWKGGHVAEITQHLKNHDLAYSNPMEWIWTTLIPQLEKAGIHDRIKQAQYVAQFASTAVGGGFISSVITQEASIKKEAGNIGAAQKGGQALNTLYKEDFSLQLTSFQAAFHNMMADLGKPMLKDAAEALRLASAGLNALGQWAHNNPELAHRLEELATALALFAVGTAAYSGLMFMAGPMIKVAAGISAFVASMPGAGAVANVMAVLARLTGFMTFLYGMKPSSTNDGEAEFLRKFKEMSPEEQKKSLDPSRWVPPSSSRSLTENHGPVRVIVENAKDLASGVSNHIADKMSRPQSGPTGPDLRYTPPMPGMGLAY